MRMIEHSGGRIVMKLTAADRRISERARWRQYELEKRTWCALHPDATSAEFDHAMRLIARKCGV
jgi:hypothetical protein